MTLIDPLTLNMSITRAVLEGKSDNILFATAQKVAVYSILPFAIIVIFEAVIKNLICFNIANCGIALINKIHSLIYPADEKPIEPQEIEQKPLEDENPLPIPAQRHEAVILPPTKNSARRITNVGIKILGVGFLLFAGWRGVVTCLF